VQATPLFEIVSQTDYVKEGPFASHAANRGAMVVVEVAMHRDAAGFCERDRLSDLAAFEVTNFH
jgi:hypothetical protein